MPPPMHDDYPIRDDVLDYLTPYETRYEWPIKRPVRVQTVECAGERLELATNNGRFTARFVVTATGT